MHLHICQVISLKVIELVLQKLMIWYTKTNCCVGLVFIAIRFYVAALMQEVVTEIMLRINRCTLVPVPSLGFLFWFY